MDVKENNSISFKSHILLPILFALTLTFAIMFMVVDDFTDGLNQIIIWFYFGVVIAYSIVAIIDNFYNKEKAKKMKIFTTIMAILTIVADILYCIFYLIVK